MKLEAFVKQRLGQDVNQQNFIRLLKEKRLTIHEIADAMNLPISLVEDTISDLRLQQVMIEDIEGIFSIREEPKQGGSKSLNPYLWDNDIMKFGFVSDNHLGSNFERVDVLKSLYDMFEREGIKIVLNGGNFIEGEARFNKNEIHTHGFHRQIDYATDVYPYHPGMETWFISGDDHEGWYNQREGINSGDYLQLERERKGMFDLKHLGYVEADIQLSEDVENPLWLRLMHPGGGTAYAISYSAQKIVESLQESEKPHILMLGHYHKLSYDFIRGVHVVQMGCTTDQSIFMRKKRIEAHVGGGIIELQRGKSGEITRFKVELLPYFDRKFYAGKDKYWK